MKWTQSRSELENTVAPANTCELAQVEALRAIAEELEKLNGVLERVLAGEVRITSSDEPAKPDDHDLGVKTYEEPDRPWPDKLT